MGQTSRQRNFSQPSTFRAEWQQFLSLRANLHTQHQQSITARTRLLATSRCPLLNLPPELILCIGTHLTPLTLTTFSLTHSSVHTLFASPLLQHAARITHSSSDGPFQNSGHDSPEGSLRLSSGNSPLHRLAARRNHRGLRRLLGCYRRLYGEEETKRAVNRRDYMSVSPLLSALVCNGDAAGSRLATVRVLLEFGAEAEPACCASSAAVEGRKEKEKVAAVEKIIAGIPLIPPQQSMRETSSLEDDPKRIDCSECRYPTPLMYALAAAHEQKEYSIVKLLLEQGIDAGVVLHPRKDPLSAQSALEVAVRNRDVEALRLVLKMGRLGDALLDEECPLRVAIEVMRWSEVWKVAKEVLGENVFLKRARVVGGAWAPELSTSDPMKMQMPRLRMLEGHIRSDERRIWVNNWKENGVR